ADELADLLGQDRVEIGGRLVVEDQLGVDRQRARDRDALAHPARELARQLVLGALELHVGEDSARDRVDLRRGVAPALAQPEAHVLGHGEGGEQRRALEDHGDAPLRRLSRPRAHQPAAKLPRTIRKSKTRIRMKLHTTAAVVAVAIPSVPPRVRRPKVQGRIEAIMPKIRPFTSPIRMSLRCTHSSMRAKYSFTVSLIAGSMATTTAPPHTPMKSE